MCAARPSGEAGASGPALNDDLFVHEKRRAVQHAQYRYWCAPHGKKTERFAELKAAQHALLQAESGAQDKRSTKCRG